VNMAYELSWFDDNKRVIFIKVTGVFTLEDSQSSSVKIRELIAEGTSPVHLIGDLRGLEQTARQQLDIGLELDLAESIAYTRFFLGYQLLSQEKASWCDEMIVNGHGSIDLYFGPRAPTGKEANWIQTVPRKGWFCLLRLNNQVDGYSNVGF